MDMLLISGVLSSLAFRDDDICATSCCLLSFVAGRVSWVNRQFRVISTNLTCLKLCVFCPACNFFYIYTHSFIHSKLFYQTDNSKCFLTSSGPCCLCIGMCKLDSPLHHKCLPKLAWHKHLQMLATWPSQAKLKMQMSTDMMHWQPMGVQTVELTRTAPQYRGWVGRPINSPACYILRTDVQSSAFSLACTDHLSEKSRDCHSLANTTVCVTGWGSCLIRGYFYVVTCPAGYSYMCRGAVTLMLSLHYVCV